MRYEGTRARYVSTVIGAIVVVAGLQASPAVATTEDDHLDAIAGHVDAAVERIGVANDSDNAQPVAERLAGETVTISDELSVKIPAEFDDSNTSIAEDGTAIRTSTTGEALSIASLTGGVRLSTVVSAATQEHSFTYQLPEGTTAEAQPDGSVLILGEPVAGEDGGELTPILATVHAAWAVDAQGASVATSYTVSANSITQTVEPNASTAYPIVADPQFENLGYQVRLRFNKAETGTLSDWGPGAAAFAAATCAGAAAGIGPVIAASVGAACCVSAAGAGVAASNALNAGQCVQGTFTPIPPVIPGTPAYVAWWDGYTGGNCT